VCREQGEQTRRAVGRLLLHFHPPHGPPLSNPPRAFYSCHTNQATNPERADTSASAAEKFSPSTATPTPSPGVASANVVSTGKSESFALHAILFFSVPGLGLFLFAGHDKTESFMDDESIFFPHIAEGLWKNSRLRNQKNPVPNLQNILK